MDSSSKPSVNVAGITPPKAMRIPTLFGCMVALALALGCSSPQGGAPAAPSGDEPKYGGILNVDFIHAAPADLDILSVVSLPGDLGSAYNSLVRFDAAKSVESGVIVPDLAERWEVSADGKTVTFYLYKNVKWHDGVPFTAADVKYTFDRILDPKDPKAVKLAQKRTEAPPIDRVEVADDHTVRFLLKRPSASLLSTLGAGGYRIVAKHAWDKMDLSHDIMGTGPFKLKNYQAGVSFQFEKNPDYFVKGLPYLDGLTMYNLKDDAAHSAAFITKQTDLVRRLEKTMWDQIHNDVPEARLELWNALQSVIVGVNVSRKPYDDPRVRKALFLALDLRGGNQLIVKDWGTIGAYIPPGPFALPQEELKAFPGYGDPQAQLAEAKRLLAEAGFPQGFKASMITSTGHPFYEASAIWAKDQLKKNLNIDATLEVSPNASALRTQGQYDLITVLAGLFNPDPSGRRYWQAGNFFFFNDQEIFDLDARQDSTLDPAERKKLVNEMERKLLDRGPFATISWAKQGTALHPWVRNHFEPIGLWSNMMYDQVWLAK